MLLRQLRSCGDQISLHMDAGGEEVRHQHDSPRTLFHTPSCGLDNIRLGKLQIGWFDDRMPPTAQAAGDVQQIRVRIGVTAAVSDQDQGRWFHTVMI